MIIGQLKYYFNPKSKSIYRGKYFDTASVVSSANSAVPIKENDTITVFYDGQLKKIVWYVNKKYCLHIALPQNEIGNLKVFIFIATEGDIISIL